MCCGATGLGWQIERPPNRSNLAGLLRKQLEPPESSYWVFEVPSLFNDLPNDWSDLAHTSMQWCLNWALWHTQDPPRWLRSHWERRWRSWGDGASSISLSWPQKTPLCHIDTLHKKTQLTQKEKHISNTPRAPVKFSGSVVTDSLWPYGLQHARLPCPSSTPGATQIHGLHALPLVSPDIQTAPS